MKYVRRNEVIRVMLGVIVAAGVISVVVLAPNTLQLLKFTNKRHRSYINRKYYINRKLRALEDDGYIRCSREDGEVECGVTRKGERLLGRLQVKHAAMRQAGRKWDGRWHIVIFDIKESSRRMRDALRGELKDCGFKQLQKSVWVSPYDPTEILSLLKVYYGLGRNVVYLRADKIENENILRKRFKLT